ncbi:MAG: hypothetical protein VB031_04405 [Eubacteriaceae bacterium]|nr:hypothetical protein [Eubacteriaceae bacterium]
MSIKRVTLLYVIAFIMQLSFINLISIGGIGPNLILCLTVVIIFKYENGFRCIPFGIAACLLLDICVGSYVGPASLAIFATGIAVTWVRIYLNTDLYKTMASVGAAATLLYGIVSWIILAILQTNYSFIYMLRYQIFFMIYNVLIMAAIFFFMSDRFARWRNSHRRNKEEEI